VPSAYKDKTGIKINRTKMINRKSISIIFTELNLKFYLSDKLCLQNLIKTKVALFEPPLFKAPPDALFLPDPPILMR
jgi:hypothetical protein